MKYFIGDKYSLEEFNSDRCKKNNDPYMYRVNDRGSFFDVE